MDVIKKSWKIVLILLIGAILRIYRIDVVPERITQDEMSIGYNAYSILKTGKDEWGRSWPLFFEAFGDWKQPLYIYLTVPFVYLWGLTPIAVKAVSIISGTFSIFAVSKLADELFSNKIVGWLAAFFLALSPVTVHLSRSALESNLAMALFLGGIWLFMRNKLETKDNIWSAILLGLTFYTYIAYRLIVILWVGLISFRKLLANNRVQSWMKKWILTFTLVILPMVPSFITRSGQARFMQISVFTDEGIEALMAKNRESCFLANPQLSIWCRVSNNRILVIFGKFFENYLKIISPTFLMIDGDRLKYLSVDGYADIFSYLIPFYLIGLVLLFVNDNKAEINSNNAKMINIAFLIAGIPCALVGEPQVVRASAMLPLVIIYIAFGVYWTGKKLKEKKMFKLYGLILVGLCGVSLFLYYPKYLYVYAKEDASFYYGLGRTVSEYLEHNQDKYDLIYINEWFSNPHMFVAYTQKVDPEWYQNNVVFPDHDDLGFSHPIKLGKYKFGQESLKKYLCGDYERILYIAPPTELECSYINQVNFSGVHVEAKLFDIDETKTKWEEQNYLVKYCKGYEFN